MTRFITGLMAAALALAPLSAAMIAADTLAAMPKRTVPRLAGTISATNAAQYTTFVSDRLDQVIALRLTITPGTDADFKSNHYLAQVSDDLFVVFKRPGPTEGGVEVVLPKAEAKLVNGAFVIEGFFVVRSGGMHQGTLSYGLERMDPGIATAGGAVVKEIAVTP